MTATLLFVAGIILVLPPWLFGMSIFVGIVATCPYIVVHLFSLRHSRLFLRHSQLDWESKEAKSCTQKRKHQYCKWKLSLFFQIFIRFLKPWIPHQVRNDEGVRNDNVFFKRAEDGMIAVTQSTANTE